MNSKLTKAQPCPEKPKACANEPKPPRVTPPEPLSEEPADEEWLAESLLKKLERDDEREPLLPLDELLPVQAVSGCAGAAMPGEGGLQFCRGISA